MAKSKRLRMKKIVGLTAAFLMFTSAMSLVGCDMVLGGSSVPDYNADVQAVAPEKITDEHFVAEDNTTYYTSPGLALWVEVNGVYLKLSYFALEGSKRVYDNLYFYEDDYFVMASDDLRGWYASLSDVNDFEYAEEEKEAGEDIQINVKKSGIYKLTFDVETLKFDMEYKSEIQTPVYYTIKNCSIYTKETEWVEMVVNPDNEEEFVIQNFHVDAGEFISFFNYIHTSHYKVGLEERSQNTYGVDMGADIRLNVGGNYNIYINKKTYVVRLELLNPDTATYSCVYYDGTDFIQLQPYETGVPYVFRQRLVVETQYTTSVPKFHTKNYKTYALTVLPSDLLMSAGSNYYFKQPGTYDIIINLKTFEITVELLPE